MTPEHPQGSVFPSAWATFATQVRLGAFHVLSGADHLLFLLVVLVACVGYGLSVPSSLVEPAIAATIVGMAVFDRALIHGLGLAGALTDLGLDGMGRALSLVGSLHHMGQSAIYAILLWLHFSTVPDEGPCSVCTGIWHTRCQYQQVLQSSILNVRLYETKHRSPTGTRSANQAVISLAAMV